MNGKRSHFESIQYQRVKFIFFREPPQALGTTQVPMSWQRNSLRVKQREKWYLFDSPTLHVRSQPGGGRATVIPKYDSEVRKKRAFTFSWQHSWCCGMAVTRLLQSALSGGIWGWSLRACCQLLSYLKPAFERPLHYYLYFSCISSFNKYHLIPFWGGEVHENSIFANLI